jgi:hypothetical protein
VHAEGATEGEMWLEADSRAPYIGWRGKGRRRPRRWGRVPAVAAINARWALGAAVAGGEERRRVGASARIEGGSVGRRRGAGEGTGGEAGEAGGDGRRLGEDGAPEVGDDPDRWAPLVGECVREGRERWAGGIVWAGRDCLGRKRWMGRRELKKKEKEWREEREVGCGIRLGRAGDRPCVGLKEGKGVWFF